jgi:hypothetical protein
MIVIYNYQRLHLIINLHTRKPYFYEYIRSLNRLILKIDEVAIYVSLSRNNLLIGSKWPKRSSPLAVSLSRHNNRFPPQHVCSFIRGLPDAEVELDMPQADGD